MFFKDRYEAWLKLAELIKNKRLYWKDSLLIAIPRWWLPVAYKIAEELKIPVWILPVKKLAPLAWPEYWFGAMDPDGIYLVDIPYAQALWVDEIQFQQIKSKTLVEIVDKIKKYTNWNLPDVSWKNVIIVDDWVATWFTVAVAADWVRRHWAKKVILAVPVCPSDIWERLKRYFDLIICLSPQQNFQAVWQFYEDFHQVEDSEFLNLRKALEKMNLIVN